MATLYKRKHICIFMSQPLPYVSPFFNEKLKIGLEMHILGNRITYAVCTEFQNHTCNNTWL